MSPESSRSICMRSGLPGPIRCSWPDILVERSRAHAIGQRARRIRRTCCIRNGLKQAHDRFVNSTGLFRELRPRSEVQVPPAGRRSPQRSDRTAASRRYRMRPDGNEYSASDTRAHRLHSDLVSEPILEQSGSDWLAPAHDRESAEDGRKIEGRICIFQRVTAYSPEGKDKRLAGMANPFFRQV